MTREKQIFRITIIGSIVNAVLLVLKFIAGILGHSSAMIADAVHSLSDFITDIIVLVFVKISGRPKDRDHDYGHGKYETLATAMIGIGLLAVGAGILYKGISNIVFWAGGGQLQAPETIAIWAALISIVSKEILYRVTVRCGLKVNSDAVVANAWHHRSDALSSIGTAVGIGGAIILGERWTVLDPIASVVVSFFIIKVSFDLLKEGIGELLERSLPDEVEKEILDVINSFSDVSDPHHLCTRRIGNYYAIEFHVRMDGNTTLKVSHARATQIEKALRGRFGASTHIVIHVEPVK